ncbi:MAG: aldehyde dehydrogenase family protein [bacterium]
MTIGKILIDGELTGAANGATYETIDPGTGRVIGEVARAGRADAEAAIDAAHRAFERGTWSGLAPEARARIVMELADRLQVAAPRLAMMEAMDSGGLVRRTASDVFQAARFMRTLASYVARDYPWTEELPTGGGFIPSRNYLRREPFGVCAGIVPWNFPFLMAVWKIVPAILMGNTVVLKPASVTPLSACLLGEIVRESGIPNGVVNVLPGLGAEVGEVLCTHPKVAKVAFTGSTEVGRHVMKLGSATVKKVTLELGGKSANIVLDDADLDLAIDGALFACFLHSGQVCESGTRLLLPAKLHDSFVERLAKRAGEIPIGYQLDARSKMGPVVSDKQRATIDDYVRIGKEGGAEVVCGGAPAQIAGFEEGYYYPPTIFAGVRNDMRIAREEIFGPVLSVIRYHDVDEAVAIANDSEYGLGGGIWSRNLARAESVAARIQTGTTWINDFHAFSDMAPFGGYKQSGIGRELGHQGLSEFVQLKHVHVGLSARPEDKIGFHLLLKEPKSATFAYSGPTRVFSGPRAVARLDLEARALGGKRVLLVSDAGVMGAGLVDRVRDVLGPRIAATVADVPQDSGLDVIDRAADVGRAAGCDLIVALGGGSVIDTAKVVGVVLSEGGRAIDHVRVGGLTKKPLPLIAIPTTAGTGSEVTNAAVVKNERMESKVFVVDEKLFPDVAILDPELLATLPRRMTASTGFDALTHAIEAATSRISNPISDSQALHAIRLIARWLPVCVENGADLEARGQMQSAATLAGFAVASAQVGLVHSMSHSIGARCGVPHGTGNGILLPHVMRFNVGACVDKMARVAEALGATRDGMSEREKADAAADAVAALLVRCGHPTGLREVGVTEDVLGDCASLAIVDITGLFTARPVKDPGQVVSLYEGAMG